VKPFLVFENGTTYTKEQFDNKANVYAEELRSAGYNKTCRIGVYSNIENIFKLFGAMKVCSPTIIDATLTKTELSYYDVDIWAHELPKPRYNQCKEDEVVGICSSGSTEQPRIVPLTEQQYNVNGLDVNIQLHGKITQNDITINCIPLWVCIGFQTFALCYKTGATYYVLDDPWQDWPTINPTFFIGSPNVLNKLMQTDVPYKNMSVRHIRTVGAPMYKDFKIKAQQYFNCITTDSYGINEVGTISIMHHPQKYDSVGHVLEDIDCKIVEGEIVVNGFATGDLGHIDDDGFLFITGRKKEVIINGGWKIMPYEVEKALLDCGATDCIVYGYDSVHALVVGNVDEDKLKQSLSVYKIPHIKYVDSIPRKGQGKINRKDLLDELNRKN
jgi:acyl-coenzyme A synthetase/AMP-(fatty) acid ligase